MIKHLCRLLAEQGFRAHIHFELEGTVVLQSGVKQLDFAGVNQALATLNVAGELKKEYWRNQWEYVSHFAGQTPWQEAEYLAQVMHALPHIMSCFGAKQVLMQPIAWQGDTGRYLPGSSEIFSTEFRAVHIPNAIQLNLSVSDQAGHNLLAKPGLGEWIQCTFLQQSYANCLLFLPETDAFTRLALRDEYALDAELSSPVLLSGGHQGSIALYREKGKHNQAMGQQALLYGQDGSALCFQHNWQKTARIEHRLGATSRAYNPYMNVLFALLVLHQGLAAWQSNKPVVKFNDKPLPANLPHALDLFKQDTWLREQIDRFAPAGTTKQGVSLGKQICQSYINQFEPKISLRSDQWR